MGHFVLIVLHGCAALFFWPALFLTISGHVVYGVIAANSASREQQRNADLVAAAEMRSCPVCAERIQRAATVCRYCRTAVAPLPSNPGSTSAYRTGSALARALRRDKNNPPLIPDELSRRD